MTNTVAGVHLGPDTHANRPAATAVTAGSLYSCSDHSLVYRSDGSSWATWATLGGTVSADLKQAANAYLLSFVTGSYYDGTNERQYTTKTLASDTLYFSPIYIPTAATFDRIGINVTTLGSGASGRLGIYEADADGLPGDLLLDAGTVDCSSTGGKEITISQALSADTVYWLALAASAVFSVTAPGTIPGPVYGLPSLTATNPATEILASVLQAHTFGALPDPATGVADDGHQPSIRLRAT